jgi:hypothetical protein
MISEAFESLRDGELEMDSYRMATDKKRDFHQVSSSKKGETCSHGCRGKQFTIVEMELNICS